ncbi:MAG TPA: site-2 protease family protein [Myxococcaceae bacterium]|nr:site-2 protease family protein [Myxococcaceae bacterium]
MTSLRIATIRGIPIRIHVSFLLVLPFLALLFGRVFNEAAIAAGVPPGALGGPAWMWGLGLAIALFASVLLHELAHAFFAIQHGGRVRDIVLLMIGGVSRLEEPPRRPRDEAWMAFVGPLTSLGLGVLAFGLSLLAMRGHSFGPRFALFYLAQLNVFLGLFNLLPAFPMDGGRVLRALLAPRLGRVRATRIAGLLGKGFALLFGLAGLFTGNVLLILVAFFVFMGADAETRSVVLEAALGGLRVNELMSPPPPPVSASAPISEIAERMKRERLLALPVETPGEGVMGIVTANALKRVPPHVREEARAETLIARTTPASPWDEVWIALRSMLSQRVPELPVVDQGRLVGMLQYSEVTRALQLRELDGFAEHRLYKLEA